jgi:hypothetical protein
MKRKWWLALLVFLPGGLVLAALALSADLYFSLQTGNAQADAFIWPTIYGLILKNMPTVDFADVVNQGRALMMVLLAENSFNATAPYPGPVGDLGDSRGPSISPWQILRQTAIANGYYADPTDGSDVTQAYGNVDTLGNIYAWAANAADNMAKFVWPNANGSIRSALAIWNGGPNGQNVNAAQVYAGNAIAGTSPAAPTGAPSGWGIS